MSPFAGCEGPSKKVHRIRHVMKWVLRPVEIRTYPASFMYQRVRGHEATQTGGRAEAQVRSRRGGLRLLAALTILSAGIPATACAGRPGSTSSSTTFSFDQPNATTARIGSAAATSQVSSTTSLLSPDEAVRAAHSRFMAMFALIGDPPNPDHPEIGATTTGTELARLKENLAGRRDAKRRTVGGYRSSITSIHVDGDRATVRDCSLDVGVGYDATGAIAGPADSLHYMRSTELVRLSVGWRVSEFIRGEPCVAN